MVIDWYRWTWPCRVRASSRLFSIAIPQSGRWQEKRCHYRCRWRSSQCQAVCGVTTGASAMLVRAGSSSAARLRLADTDARDQAGQVWPERSMPRALLRGVSVAVDGKQQDRVQAYFIPPRRWLQHIAHHLEYGWVRLMAERRLAPARRATGGLGRTWSAAIPGRLPQP